METDHQRKEPDHRCKESDHQCQPPSPNSMELSLSPSWELKLTEKFLVIPNLYNQKILVFSM